MQDFIVTEIQRNDQGTVSTISIAYEDYWTAQQKYHTVLSFAAVSDLPIHGAVILSPYGDVIEKKSYNHRASEPEE